MNEKNVGSAHLLLAILRDRDSVAGKTLAAMNVDFDRLRADLQSAMPEGSALQGDIYLSAEAKQVIDRTYEEARNHGVSYIGTEHLLLGIMSDSLGLGTIALGKQGVTLESARIEAHRNSGATSAQFASDRLGVNAEPPAPDDSRLLSRFTEKARKVIYYAQQEADQHSQASVGEEHLLLGLMQDDDSVAAIILSRLNVNFDQLRTAVVEILVREVPRTGTEMRLSPSGERVVNQSSIEAKNLSNAYLGTEHLLLGVIAEPGRLTDTLPLFGLDLETVRQSVRELQAGK